MKLKLLTLTLFLPMMTSAVDWKMAKASLTTEWGETVTTENAWKEYPRPQLQRENWTNMNGIWNYVVTAQDAKKPKNWNGEILAPYCLESPLSGVGRLIEPTEALWYERTFDLDKIPSGKLLLNFEAVDYLSDIWVNGKHVGSHQGGNLCLGPNELAHF